MWGVGDNKEECLTEIGYRVKGTGAGYVTVVCDHGLSQYQFSSCL